MAHPRALDSAPCTWCGTPAPPLTIYTVKETPFGPEPICGACEDGDVGPWYRSPAWCEARGEVA